MAFRWSRAFGRAWRAGASRHGMAMGTVTCASLAAAPFTFTSHAPLKMESMSLEERVRHLEAKINLLEKDDEEVRAIEILKRRAKEHGLDIAGGTIRRSSSRFCLAVEHGDYNGTELFGVGTDRFIWMAFKPNSLGKVRIYSDNFPEAGVIEYTPGGVPPPQSPEIADTWARFAYGSDWVLHQNGFKPTTGFDAVLLGNIPGGGMSRSASLILNIILTTLDVNKASLPEGDFKIVKMACSCENDYVGTPCGNLDQIMIYYAKEGMGTRFNPKTNQVSYVPLGVDANDFRIAALDTGTVRHGLEKSTYAVRVKECIEFVDMLRKNGYAIDRLGDVKDKATYDKITSQFGSTHPELCKRLQYIYFAQERFEAMVAAWTKGDIETVGAIFRRDGVGLRDEYVISGPELETMVDVARTVPGVMGERMLGGGDKGAAGAILHTTAEQPLRDAVDCGYKRSHPDFADKCHVHVVKVCQGISVMEGLL